MSERNTTAVEASITLSSMGRDKHHFLSTEELGALTVACRALQCVGNIADILSQEEQWSSDEIEWVAFDVVRLGFAHLDEHGQIATFEDDEEGV